MTLGYQIVPAVVSAAAVIAGVHRACFDHPWSEASIVSLMSIPGTYGWLTIDPSGQPVAALMVRQMANQADVLTLGVCPSVRRMGLARSLMRAAEAALAATGSVKVFLEVAESNLSGVALYESLGYVESGRRRNYYVVAGSGVDAVVMSKTVGD